MKTGLINSMILLIVASLSTSSNAVENPNDILDVIKETGQDQHFDHLREQTLNNIYGVPYFSGTLKNNSIFSFDAGPNSLGLVRAELDAFLEGSAKWQQFPRLTSEVIPQLQNGNIIDLQCAEEGFTKCLATISSGGSDRTAVVEVNVLDGKPVDGGFTLPFGYNQASYLNRDGSKVIFWHTEDEFYPNKAQPFRVWSEGHKLEEAPVVLESNDNASYSSMIDLGSDTGLIIGMHFDERLADDYYVDATGNVSLSNLSYYAENALHETYRACIPVFAKKEWLYCKQIRATIVQAGEQEFEIPYGSVIAIPTVTLYEDIGDELRLRPVYVPKQGEVVEDAIKLPNGGLVRTYLPGEGRNKLTYFSDDRRVFDIELPTSGAIDNIQPSSSDDSFILAIQDNLSPAQYYYFHIGKTREESRTIALPFNTAESEQARYASETRFIERDGQKIFYDIIGNTEALSDGNAPTVITAYGHYSRLIKPAYMPGLKQGWLDQGGIYVVAHPRGGRAFSDWPYVGNPSELERRQITVDDFVAVTKELIRSGVSDPAALHSEGASAGASLVTTAALQNPGMFKSVAARAGCFDINITIDACSANYFRPITEGLANASDNDSVDDPLKARLLSPMAIVDAALPQDAKTSFLLIGNRNDDRVSLEHSERFASQLEKAGYPVFTLYRDFGGHSVAASEDGFAGVRSAVWAFFKGMDAFAQNARGGLSGEVSRVAKLAGRFQEPDNLKVIGCNHALDENLGFQIDASRLANSLQDAANISHVCILDVNAPFVQYIEPSTLVVSSYTLQSVQHPTEFIGLAALALAHSDVVLENIEQLEKQPVLSKDTRLAELGVLAALVAGARVNSDQYNGTTLDVLTAPEPVFEFSFDGRNIRDRQPASLAGKKAYEAMFAREAGILASVRDMLLRAGLDFPTLENFLKRTQTHKSLYLIKYADLADTLPLPGKKSTTARSPNLEEQKQLLTSIRDRLSIETAMVGAIRNPAISSHQYLHIDAYRFGAAAIKRVGQAKGKSASYYADAGLIHAKAGALDAAFAAWQQLADTDIPHTVLSRYVVNTIAPFARTQEHKDVVADLQKHEGQPQAPGR